MKFYKKPSGRSRPDACGQTDGVHDEAYSNFSLASATKMRVTVLARCATIRLRFTSMESVAYFKYGTNVKINSKG
jgi:hypothetical protein